MSIKIFAETERLILRELLPSDAEGMFELDSDPEVHRYLGNDPVKTIERCWEVIEFVRNQYVENGIGRWAMVEKGTNNFLGWTGLKLVKTPMNNHIDYYDLGYRLIRKHWGKGFATEAAHASLAYGFNKLDLDNIHATADVNNKGSRNVLEKAGLKYIETFDEEGHDVAWYGITKEDWRSETLKRRDFEK